MRDLAKQKGQAQAFERQADLDARREERVRGEKQRQLGDDAKHGGGDGGERAGGAWYVRAATLEQLQELYPRVHACFEAGALATGTELVLADPPPPYSEFLHDPDLVAAYRRRAEALGREFADLDPQAGNRLAGSTDMANVSREIPSIHPMIAVEANGAVNHQPGFTAACATPSADRAVRDGAVAMAHTVIDAAADPAVRERLLSRAFDSSTYEIPVVG